jgi:transcriptional regulator with XRE-family HTH domain
MAAASQDLFVWAEKKLLPEATSVFTQLGARVHGVPLERPGSLPQSRFIVVYLQGKEPESELHSALRSLKERRKYELLLFYAPHHGHANVFRLGTLVGRELGRDADLAFDLRHVRQVLKSRNLLTQKESGPEFDPGEARKRLGLTQEQMAIALNVTTRTVQNWERVAGTGQMLRKARDLRELLELMDDYVVASEEAAWLTTPLDALRGRTPKETIASGKVRDLVLEFERLREGQPV